MFRCGKETIDSIMHRDPAAKSRIEVLLCYPGLHALMFYCVSNWLWTRNLCFFGRFVSHVGKIFTGIEIHPGARIGKRLFIDHGTGTVIGETAEIGDDVTIYHDVTLGGTSVTLKDGTTLNYGKRHPTLEDGVIVGAGAQVLGPITLGKNSRVGANAVVVADVKECTTVVGIPARPAGEAHTPEDTAAATFSAYALPTDGHIIDPVTRAFEDLKSRLEEMQKQIESIEKNK